MRNTRTSGLVLSLAIVLIAISSCKRENLPTGAASGKIKTKVAAMSTKASINSRGELTRTIVISEKDSLILQEFVSDNFTQPFDAEYLQTKGTVVTTDNIKLFGMEGFVDYNSIDCDDANWPKVYNPGTGKWEKLDDDHYIIGGVSTYSDNAWTLKDGGGQEYLWLNDIDFTFWSYVPETLSFTIAESRTNMTISDYSNPVAAADQKDLLIAYNTQKYAGTAESQTVNINFYHALADVYFDVSNIADVEISQITISNAYKKGTCTVVSSGNDISFIWSDRKSKDVFTMQGTSDHFFMIPQELPSDATIAITLSDGTTLSPKPLATTWLAGKFYRYVLRYEGGEVVVSVVEDFEPNSNVKKNVCAKNESETGNVFVRMAITTNWVDSNGNVILPCEFNHTPSGNWVKHTDGYYYYKKAIAPDATTKEMMISSYTAPTPPMSGLNLDMDILLQSVKYDESCAKAKAAWGIGDGILIPEVEE